MSEMVTQLKTFYMAGLSMAENGIGLCLTGETLI